MLEVPKRNASLKFLNKPATVESSIPQLPCLQRALNSSRLALGDVKGGLAAHDFT